MADRAIFLDRDGTLIEDPGYLDDPAKVRLLPGVDLALKTFRNAGYRIVIVTNQSAVARGIITEERLKEIHFELKRQLEEKGAEIDAIYYCPYHPEGTVEYYKTESDLRKPAPGMLLKAAGEMDIDMNVSWMIGDSERDVQAGNSAGCRTVRLIDPESFSQADTDWENTEAVLVARNLVDAARQIVNGSSEQDGDIADEEESSEQEDGLLVFDVAPDEDVEEPETVKEKVVEEETRTTTAKRSEDSGLSDSHVRREILSCVRQISRDQHHEDEFSLFNMLGGLSQSLVVLFLILALYEAIGPADLGWGTFWAVIAMTFQVMSLTFFTIVRTRR